MASHEWLAAGYFVGLSLAAAAAPVAWQRRLLVSAVAVGVTMMVALVAGMNSLLLRDWAPHFYLVAGYWLPGLLVARSAETTRFEQWLVRSDLILRRRLGAIPRALAPITELAYLLCYPLIPVACAVVWTRGTDADLERFWVAVLAAGYACYVSLPWLVSRPPRLIPHAAPTSIALPVPPALASANVFVLGRVSHELNTFPSGHVAVSGAAAAMLAPVSPVIAAIIGVMAIVIAVGAVAGRYHYVVDVLFGFAVAAGAVALAVQL
jgi:membrane-associated phospholipid phosphatase